MGVVQAISNVNICYLANTDTELNAIEKNEAAKGYRECWGACNFK